MAKIKIDDLPKDTKISKDEMKRVLGGMTKTLLTTSTSMGWIGDNGLIVDDVTKTWPNNYTIAPTETTLMKF